MLRKNFSKTGRSCRVTFTVPSEVPAERVYVSGEFNDWDRPGLPLVRRKDGRFSNSVSLETGRAYRFRYLLDGERWENDAAADGYVPNPFGSEDSLLEI